MKVLEIASQYSDRLINALDVIEEENPNILTITAIALATFGLFIDVDVKRVVSKEDIIESARRVIIPAELLNDAS